MLSVNLGKRISLAGWAAALCLPIGAVALWLWRYPASTRPNPARLSPARPTPDPNRSIRQDPDKNKTDTLEDALEPNESLSQEGDIPLRDASSHPNQGQRQKDQTEPDNPTQVHPKSKGVNLRQVYPSPENKTVTDVDIIAIHGFDTKSPDTWTWVDPNDRNNKVNWLADPQMLPSEVGAARIFTCDWPADLLQPSDLAQKTVEEYALLLLDGIQREILVTDAIIRERRPVFFIASCLGGIILAKTLVDASDEYRSVKEATRGIIFLATPFRGTSFQDIAAFAEPGLTAWAFLRGREASKLLNSVKGSTFDLETLIRKFTQLCKDEDYQVFNFYEKGKTSLPSKIFPRLPVWLRQEKQLVDESSATLDIVRHPLPLDRSHVLTNKFGSPKCPDYETVAKKIRDFLATIRDGKPLAQADAWIRKKCYTEDRLKIKRLSGKELPMEQCYINRSIVERLSENAEHSKKDSEEEDAAPQSSPFSLPARLQVEMPNKVIQVDLPALFKPRKGLDGRTTQPRRILIRGRAGVGKTTLCKKIVHEFMRREWHEWIKLFDRVLWVPLRNLKLEERRRAEYNFFYLFSHEYFSRPTSEDRLAQALSSDPLSFSRTLFLLDGLDEVSRDLSGEDGMSGFLNELLNQPNVIITSRPYGKPPTRLDLELETVGFYPNQVKDYIEMAFTNQETRVLDQKGADAVPSFLKSRGPMEELMRIPIQLDALCYAWNAGINSSSKLNTMTAVYQAIDRRLWKKDVLRLKKRHNGEVVTDGHIQSASRTRIEELVKDEVLFLESLAFTGLQNDKIEFGLDDLEEIGSILPDKTVPHLSFLRTSDPLSEFSKQTCHFLHLTYQEYFAARYFVRQWKADKTPHCLQLGGRGCNNTRAADFLQKYKYDPRYDIFWRFVAGLLDADGEALGFFQMIEEEPRDLLGPTHQRLVMHCLSEVEQKKLTFTELRKELEIQLEQWLLFECDFTKRSMLASEMECPEQVLVHALEQHENARLILLESLSRRTAVPSRIISIASSWLYNSTSNDLCIAILYILRHRPESFSEEILQSIAARLEDQDRDVREAAIEAFQGRTDLTEAVVQSIAARLGSQE